MVSLGLFSNLVRFTPERTFAFLKNHGSNREKNPYRRFTMLDDPGGVGEVFEELTPAKFAESIRSGKVQDWNGQREVELPNESIT